MIVVWVGIALSLIPVARVLGRCRLVLAGLVVTALAGAVWGLAQVS